MYLTYSPWCLNLDHLKLNKLYNSAFNLLKIEIVYWIRYLPLYNAHLCIMYTLILTSGYFQKKSVSMSFFTTNNNTIVTSNLAPPAWNSITRFDANYFMFCLFGDTLSFMFSSFSPAVLLLHNQTQSICATPITSSERGDLKRARHSLATWQDSRWQRIFVWSFLFQVFPYLCKEATRYMSRSNFFKV